MESTSRTSAVSRRARSSAVALAIASFAVLSTCADAPRPDAGITVEARSDGSVRISNPETGIWGEGEAWTLVEDLRLGTVEGTGPESFTRVQLYEVDESGRMYVLDRDTREIRVFDPEGDHLFTVGRLGEGPGELQNPAGLRIDPDGNLRVVDLGNGRYSTWDRNGDFFGSARRFTDGQIFPWPGAFLEDGRVVEVDFGDTPIGRGRVFELFDAEGAHLGRVPVPTFEAPKVEFEIPGGTTSYPVAFAPALSVHFEPDGRMWTGVSSGYRIVEHDLVTGDTLRVIARAHTPDPVLDVELEAVLPVYRELAGKAGAGVDPGVFPDTHPAYTDFQTDDAGHLWVERERPLDPGATVDDVATPRPPIFDVFDEEGRYLGAVDAPTPIRNVQITRTHLYGLARDDLGVDYLVRFRIEGR